MQPVVRLDPQARSLWLADGTRLGFAAARRRGYDVEALLADGLPVNRRGNLTPLTEGAAR